MKTFWLFCVGVVLVSCTATRERKATKANLGDLPGLMQGSFTSAAQAALDTNYYAVMLHMYPIWAEAEVNVDTTWLYVEQALANMPNKPYRQRVYRVVPQSDGTWASAVFKLKDEKACVGKWKTPSFFDTISSSDLTERDGCTVYLRQQGDGSFLGSTKDRACASTMRGATYATSVVTVAEGRVESWDQGFDANGEQVWGATEGPYVFLEM